MRPTTGKTIGLGLGLAAFTVLAFFVPVLRSSERGAAPAFAAGAVALMAVWWFSEALPIALTACVPLVLFPLLCVFPGGFAANVTEATLPYVNPYIFLFVGGMFIAAAMQQWNLHRRIALAILDKVGAEPARLLLGMLLATAFISLWISNTATAAMMLPIGLAVVSQLEQRAGTGKLMGYGGALMLAIAYGANVGGIGTKIGTVPNMQFAGFAAQHGIEVSFLQFACVGLGFVVLFLPIVWYALWRSGRHDAPRAVYGRETVREEIAQLGPMQRGEWFVLAVFLTATALWIAGKPITDALAAHVTSFKLRSAHVEGAIAMLAAGVLLLARVQNRRVLELRSLRYLPWGTIVLLGGSFSMAAGVEQSGLSMIGARALSDIHALPLMSQALVAATTAVLVSAFASNTATIGLLLPLLYNAVAPEHATPVLFAATIGCSCDFMLPAGTPPNAIVFGSGYLTIARMARTGIVLNLLAAGLAAVWSVLVVPLVVK